jgi:PleD family two-component response regulator
MKPAANLPESDYPSAISLLQFKAACMRTESGLSSTSSHVLVLDNQEILGAGLENLLSGEESLNVRGLTTQDESALVDEIRRLQPDTIILMAESQLTDPLRLLELLSDYGRIRIILVSIESNRFEIYDKQQIVSSNWVSFVTKLRPE